LTQVRRFFHGLAKKWNTQKSEANNEQNVDERRTDVESEKFKQPEDHPD
jgi:hypothetical protein